MFKKTIQLLRQAQETYYRLSEIAPWADIDVHPFPWHLKTVLHGVFGREWDCRDNGGYFKDEDGILWRDPEVSEEDAESTRVFFDGWYERFYYTYQYNWFENNKWINIGREI